MKDVLKKLDERRRLFVTDIVEGRIAPVKDEEKVKDALWSALVLNQSCLYPSRLSYFFAGKPLYECTEEERKEVSEKVAKLRDLWMAIRYFGCMAGRLRTRRKRRWLTEVTSFMRRKAAHERIMEGHSRL